MPQTNQRTGARADIFLRKETASDALSHLSTPGMQQLLHKYFIINERAEYKIEGLKKSASQIMQTDAGEERSLEAGAVRAVRCENSTQKLPRRLFPSLVSHSSVLFRRETLSRVNSSSLHLAPCLMSCTEQTFNACLRNQMPTKHDGCFAVVVYLWGAQSPLNTGTASSASRHHPLASSSSLSCSFCSYLGYLLVSIPSPSDGLEMSTPKHSGTGAAAQVLHGTSHPASSQRELCPLRTPPQGVQYCLAPSWLPSTRIGSLLRQS